MITVHAPALTGTLAAWLRRPGDVVHEGDPLAIVHCRDGSYSFVDSPTDGTLEALHAQGAAELWPGKPLASLSVRSRSRALAHV